MGHNFCVKNTIPIEMKWVYIGFIKIHINHLWASVSIDLYHPIFASYKAFRNNTGIFAIFLEISIIQTEWTHCG